MKLHFAAALAVLVVAAAPAQAVITSFTLSGGSAQSNGGTALIIAAPANVAKATLNGNDIFGFNEVTNVTLSAPRPNGFRFGTADNGNINPGRPVSSHFFVFAPNAGRTATGTISFSQNVIAVQRTSGQFSSNGTSQLQTGLTDFAAITDLEGIDSITRTGLRTVSFDLTANNANSDMFRVITAVPEPTSWVMLIAGFGMVGAAARRRKTVVAA